MRDHSVDRRSVAGRRWAVLPCFLLLLAWAPGAALGDPPPADGQRQISYKPNLSAIFSGGAPSSVAELRAMEAHVQRLAELVIACTVSVRVGPAQGSGVIVSPDGYVLTAAHVAASPGQRASIILADGRRVRGETLGCDKDMDAGLVRIVEPPGQGEQTAAWPCLEMGRAENVKPGQWCLAAGHPGGYQRGRRPVIRVGRILSRSDSAIMTDCTLMGGDSGGPLVDMHGRVIGIHSRIGSALTTNLHVPVEAFRDSWDRLAAGESWGGSPFIGVQGDAEADNARIARVLPGSAAERAGVQPGDIVVEFNGQPVTTFESLSRLVKQTTPGERAPMVVLRGEERIRLWVIVGEQ